MKHPPRTPEQAVQWLDEQGMSKAELAIKQPLFCKFRF
jgi:hypothetical protein